MRKSFRLIKSLFTLKYMFFDAFMVLFIYLMAILMFALLQIELDRNLLFISIPIVIIYKITVFYFSGLYRMLENHIGFEDVIRISLVVVVSNLFLVGFIWVSGILFMYKTAFVFISFAEIALITLPRVLSRIFGYIKTSFDWNRSFGKRTMIVGAGYLGELVLKELYHNKERTHYPVLFVDNNPQKIGKRLQGIKIVGPDTSIKYFIEQYKIDEVIIAINNITTQQLNKIISYVVDTQVPIKRLMKMTEYSKTEQPEIRELRIEDLLERQEIELNNEEIRDYLKDEVVLVTGGGGSIGSELSRQIAECHPKQLIIFDIYENNAYDVQQEILRTFFKRNETIHLVVLIGSVYNHKRLESVFEMYQPTIVFHAAAYKHVPLMEDSPIEAVRTNVLGTYYAASLSKTYGVKKFVLVSSDKAVRSTNIMGATKRYAELIIQEQQNHTSKTKFAAVRFGNVLGSNGSVIPLFKKQIADGGPVTVTHREITRYFMTITEAVGLILQCGAYAQGGEVFILDMGEPVKIKDLAEKMIRLSGHIPYQDIPITFTGLRPGEKLYEELLVDHHYEDHHKTDNDKIFIEKQRNVETHELSMDELSKTHENLDDKAIKQFVANVVKTYKINGND